MLLFCVPDDLPLLLTVDETGVTSSNDAKGYLRDGRMGSASGSDQSGTRVLVRSETLLR